MTFEDVQRFARQYGAVKAWSNKTEITVLKNGEIDSVRFWKQDALQFEFQGKFYGRPEFEELVRSRLSQ